MDFSHCPCILGWIGTQLMSLSRPHQFTDNGKLVTDFRKRKRSRIDQYKAVIQGRNSCKSRQLLLQQTQLLNKYTHMFFLIKHLLPSIKSTDKDRDTDDVTMEDGGSYSPHHLRKSAVQRRNHRRSKGNIGYYHGSSASFTDVTVANSGEVEEKRNGLVHVDSIPTGLPRLHTLSEGSGSFGSVYKGILADGMIVAVKVFNVQIEGTFQTFARECEIFRNLRRRNLTKIISNCCNLDFKALILEYMPNKNLDKLLYSREYC